MLHFVRVFFGAPVIVLSSNDAAGDVAAGLTIGEARGTLGARIQEPTAILEPTNVVRYQEIVSQFTAGTATLRLLGYIIQNAGA